jgi:membrane protease YdiL (CAAX protease family)
MENNFELSPPPAEFCPVCAAPIDAAHAPLCPTCHPATPLPAAPGWGVGAGIVAWLSSVLLLLGLQIVAVLIYLLIRMKQTGAIPTVFEIDWLMAVLTIAMTFPAHLLTLLVCWWIITRGGKRPFRESIGWGWHTQFKWVHAVGLAMLMMLVAFACEKLLPHRETDMEKLLKLGASVRYLVAALAVLTAPVVEELVYRGVLYAGIERRHGRVAGVVVVTLLFALVHVPQYWGSLAAITAILSLSLVLTLVRAATGRILPCIATHLVYNGVQAVALLVGNEMIKTDQPAKTALILLTKMLW